MSDFTDKDRETLTKTLTMLDGHMEQSKERHQEIKSTLKDHETRIRKNEGIVTKVATISSFIGAGITAVIVATVRKMTG